MNGAPESQTAASASHLVGPYPIDEDALRKLKRSHDDGVIDAHEFKRRKAEALGLREGSLAWASHAVSLAAPTPRQTFPVRPELFKFTDPRAVCQLSGTSKTLQIDLQGIKAWARLAEAQYPPPTPRDDDEARSHVRRRELAKALPPTIPVLEGLTLQQAIAREKPAENRLFFSLDAFSDFTYFVRLTDGERLIFEGDFGVCHLSHQSDEQELELHLSPRQANLKWMGKAYDLEPQHVKIALVAVRNKDQAMVPLGHLNLYFGTENDGGEKTYEFRDFGVKRGLPQTARSHLRLEPALSVTKDGYVNRLELRPIQTILMRGDHDDDDHYLCDEDLFQLVLTYLAGIHHPKLRASALARIESWFVGAEREAGWGDLEALAANLNSYHHRGDVLRLDWGRALCAELGLDATSEHIPSTYPRDMLQ